MKLEGKIFKANIVIGISMVQADDYEDGFVKTLEKCLIGLCRELEIPLPLWLDKNTHEFARFRQTIFFAEQFTDKTTFDRFQIRLLKENEL